MRIIPTLAFLVAFSSCMPARNPTGHAVNLLGTLLSAQTLAAPRSFTLTETQLRGYAVLSLGIALDHTAATDVTVDCSGVMVDGGTAYVIQACDASAGACTMVDGTITKAVTGDKNFAVRVNVVGFIGVTCSIDGASGGASDLITVEGVLSAI